MGHRIKDIEILSLSIGRFRMSEPEEEEVLLEPIRTGKSKGILKILVIYKGVFDPP